MNKQIFKKEDRVFDINFGWGVVKSIDDLSLFSVLVEFGDSYIGYTADGKNSLKSTAPTLSFTEYGVDNRFSQKINADYNEYLGKWGKFWDKNSKDYFISRLERVIPNGFRPNSSIAIYDNFEPLTDEQLGLLGLKN